MAVGISATQANRILESLVRGTAFGTAPTTPMKLALHTADPGAAGTANEVAGGSYARQTVTYNAAASGATAISGNVDFTLMPAATVTHGAVFDSAGSPVFIISAALAGSVVCASGDTFRMTAFTITITVLAA
jgi:hypothetical protein